MTATMVRYLTVAEAAERLGVHQNTIRKLIKSGQLGHSRVTRWIRISEDDINDYLNRAHHDPAVPRQRHRRERPAS
jgi:excisionase family DNA binding protein